MVAMVLKMSNLASIMYSVKMSLVIEQFLRIFMMITVMTILAKSIRQQIWNSTKY